MTTPKQWRALLGGVVARVVRPGAKPSPDGERVLLALLQGAVDGRVMPPHAQLGEELDMSERVVSRAVRELHRFGLIIPADDQPDARRTVFVPNRYLLSPWAKDEYTLRPVIPDGDDGDNAQNGTDLGGDRVENGGDFRGDRVENGPFLARAAMSSSSSSFSGSAPASAPPTSAEAFDQHSAMCSAIRRVLPWGAFTAAGKDHVWGFVGVYSVALVQDVCRQVGPRSPRSLAYIEAALRSAVADSKYGEEPVTAGVVAKFDEYRARRPWHFAEGETRDEG